jgi:predicted amidohydrolase YtcJ
VFAPALIELDKLGKLPVRIVGTHLVVEEEKFNSAVNGLKTLSSKFKSDRLRFSAIKINMDGSFESKTANLLDHYHDDKHHTGSKRYDSKKLTQFVVNADAAGVDLYFHVIGDGAARQVLDAIEEARKVNKSIGKTRHTLSHLLLVDESDLGRFAKLDVMAQTTPIWHSITPGHKEVIGERANRLFRFNTISKLGGRAIYGSDFPVGGTAGLVPLFNIETGHTRKPPGEKDAPMLLPKNERLSIAQLIRGYTRDAAYLLRMENEIGTLEVGKLADVIMLDQNIFKIPPTEISNTVVERTFIDGKQVHERGFMHDLQDIGNLLFGY